MTDAIDELWLKELIAREFKKAEENITPIKILAKPGIPADDQVKQLENKTLRIKIKRLLSNLYESGYLEIKQSKNSILGQREIAYRLSEKKY